METPQEYLPAPITEISLSPPPPLTEMIGLDDERDEIQTTNPTDRDKVWSFWSSCSVLRLRILCKDAKVVQKGNKNEMKQRIFHEVSDSADGLRLWVSNEKKVAKNNSDERNSSMLGMRGA